MSTLKDYIIIYLQLIQIGALEVVIILMTCPINLRVPNKIEDLNLRVFNIITRINEQKTIIKNISCECKCTFDGKKCDSNQKQNNDKYRCQCKNKKKHRVCEKDYIWNPAKCSSKNGIYLANIIEV